MGKALQPITYFYLHQTHVTVAEWCPPFLQCLYSSLIFLQIIHLLTLYHLCMGVVKYM
jgi:hypothetical protein